MAVANWTSEWPMASSQEAALLVGWDDQTDGHRVRSRIDLTSFEFVGWDEKTWLFLVKMRKRLVQNMGKQKTTTKNLHVSKSLIICKKQPWETECLLSSLGFSGPICYDAATLQYLQPFLTDHKGKSKFHFFTLTTSPCSSSHLAFCTSFHGYPQHHYWSLL